MAPTLCQRPSRAALQDHFPALRAAAVPVA